MGGHEACKHHKATSGNISFTVRENRCNTPYLDVREQRVFVVTVDLCFRKKEDLLVWYEAVSRSDIFNAIENFIVSVRLLQAELIAGKCEHNNFGILVVL